MKIDVIIPLYKPGKALFELLHRLENQTIVPQNIILMNTEVEYFERLVRGTSFWEKFRNVKIYHLQKSDFDHGGTRHEGVLHSDSEVFVTMTQDALPVDRTLLENLTAGLDRDVAVAYARQLPGRQSDEMERISRHFNYPAKSCVKSAADMETLGIKAFFCSNVCAAYRRDIYDELGGFIRHTIFNEDIIYAAGAINAGYRIAYRAEAKVIHSHSYTNLQQLRRNFDLGVSQADHPEVFGGIVSESEGKKLIMEAWRYLKKEKRLYRFPAFFLQSCFKYAGYLLGKHYRMLPKKWVLAITTNKSYWK